MFQKLIKKPTYILLIYILITLVIYYPTIGAGMVFDFNGWTLKYSTGSYKDVLNSFGYPGLHQVEQLVFFTLYKLFNFNKFAWFFSFALLHAFTAFIAYQFILKWLLALSLSNAFQIALATSFLFLISPLAADVVVNKVTIHYLMSSMFIYAALYYLICYFKTSLYKNIIFTFILFILALFSLEISYVFPAIFFVVWLSLFYFNNQLGWSKKNLLPIVLPFIILIVFLFIHKIVVGSFIGHYGAEVHTKFNIGEIYSNIIRYFASYIVLFDYWAYKYKAIASQNLLNFSFILILISSLVVFAVGIYSHIKMKKELFFILLALILAIISLLPIANLYYAFLFPIENDRYAYLSSLFMYLFIVSIIYQIKLVNIRNGIICLFILINSLYLFQNVQTFSKSSKVTWGLLNDFRWFHKEVVILSDPDIFNGAKMFGTKESPNSFSESLFLHTGIDRRGNIKSVYQMNFTSESDSVQVEKISDIHYKIKMAQWGTWFMRNTIGATSFNNEWCKTVLYKEGINSYELFLKENNNNVVFIYAAGNKWTEVK